MKRHASRNSVAERRCLHPLQSVVIDGWTRLRIAQRLSTNDHPTGTAVDMRHLATPCGADDVPSGARVPGSASTLGMFSPDSTGLESGRAPGSTPTRREILRTTAKQVKNAHQEGTDSSSLTILHQEELISDSMHKTTLANLETKTLKAFSNIFAHRDAKIFDLCRTSRWTFTPRCEREFVAWSIRKPTPNDSRLRKLTIGKIWLCLLCLIF